MEQTKTYAIQEFLPRVQAAIANEGIDANNDGKIMGDELANLLSMMHQDNIEKLTIKGVRNSNYIKGSAVFGIFGVMSALAATPIDKQPKLMTKILDKVIDTFDYSGVKTPPNNLARFSPQELKAEAKFGKWLAVANLIGGLLVAAHIAFKKPE